jgi:small conductance mechanosensitive channel
VAIVVAVVFWVLGLGLSALVRRTADKRGRGNLGEVGGALDPLGRCRCGLYAGDYDCCAVGAPGDLFADLGVSSVAIGFAFKDILQNMLAGILILLRQPFEVGDQIVSGGHECTVEKVETRATMIKTYDGRSVDIPNFDIYTDSVVVNTAFDIRLWQYDIGMGCNDDWG